MNDAPALPDLGAEWLEADGAGGFASGTVGGTRTRRYHALLLAPLTPPTGRVVLVNGFEAWIESAAGTLALSTQHYAPDVIHPRGIDALRAFDAEPWPRWRFEGPGGLAIEHECVVDHADGTVLLAWRAASAVAGGTRLLVRPLLSGRDYHALMRENAAFDFTARAAGGNACWRPYAGLPAVAALSNGRYAHEPQWYRNFLYAEEATRGLDAIEDLASPGRFEFDLARGNALLLLRVGEGIAADAAVLAARIRAAEAERRAGMSTAQRAADAYLVRRDAGHTLIAGYPWFTDWGRDAFIALRGLLLAQGRHEAAASILDAWAGCVSEGMLPNRFADQGASPEFNAVDASLWFVVAVHELRAARPKLASARMDDAVQAIVAGYRRGTRHGIRMDELDALLACGEPGVQLTWMDAKCGNTVITPRIGKPVEVQALWINALRAAGPAFAADAARAQAAFTECFWNEAAQCLFDVIDVDHVPGQVDPSLRPNQILAVGGLPFAVLEGPRAASVLAVVERELLTPMGLRSLSPREPAYRGHYEGGPWQRDSAYHQGTAWPWLVGPFVDAWLAVRGDSAAERAAVHARCLAPLVQHLGEAGLGHVSEIADGDAPHQPRGCPFQAWSLGELVRALARTSAPATR